MKLSKFYKKLWIKLAPKELQREFDLTHRRNLELAEQWETLYREYQSLQKSCDQLRRDKEKKVYEIECLKIILDDLRHSVDFLTKALNSAGGKS